MSLIPVLQLVSLDEDSADMVVKDATGAYSGSNSSGYGNPNPESADIQAVLFQLASFSNLSSYAPYRTTGISDLFSTGLSLPALSFGGSSFLDGAYDMRYAVIFNLGAITIAPGAKNFTLANADTVLAGVSGIILSGNPDKIYYIDQTVALTSTGGRVTESFPSDEIAAQTGAQKAYEGNLKFLYTAAGNKCLNRDIAAWSDTGCEGIDFRDIAKRYMMKVAMETKFIQGLLAEAHNLALKLASYCSSTNTDCGC